MPVGRIGEGETALCVRCPLIKFIELIPLIVCDWFVLNVLIHSIRRQMPMRQKPGTRTFSAHEKLFHKAKTALQREFKRIKLFHIRKIVQQLKKLQTESSQCASTESTQTQLSKLKHKYDTLKVRNHSFDFRITYSM